jgi:predicted AAA+ superfamily ATPase
MWWRGPSPISIARSRRSFRPSVGSDYEQRIKAAYPIHPEIFDRLYTDWSTLVKFQRTRGVLRLMAAVIHSLWEKGDRNPLILPATCRSMIRACSRS